MKFNRLLVPGLLVLAVLGSACSPREAAAPAAVVKKELTPDDVASQAKGFAVGALMSANTVYVFFDPQCPHCGHLWEASVPLHKKVKFVWIPIGMINATSVTQGAAILTAASPLALMAEHEASLLAGKGGISASSSIAPEIMDAIQRNTQLFNSSGAESVPFIVAKNLKTGLTVSRDGALGTPELATFLGVDAP